MVPLPAPVSDVASSLPVVEVAHDVNITGVESWRDTHYRIYGNVTFHENGTLFVENCVVELMGTFDHQYVYKWAGGTLITTNSTIGGTRRNGVAAHAVFQLLDGEWYATDTTVQYHYGIAFDWDGQGVGKLRAVHLVGGKDSGEVILGGRGDVVIKESDCNIGLTISAWEGGTCVLDLPVDTPLTRVYDASNLMGVEYRLELINTKVNFWSLFANIAGEGPPAEVTLANCPSFLPAISAYNLKGELKLPCSFTGETAPRWESGEKVVWKRVAPHTTFTTGNLTWKVGENPLNIFTWGLYFSGTETDVTIRGPISICELMLFDAKRVVIEGDEGTHNVWSPATTIRADFGHVHDVEVPLAIGPDGTPQTVNLEMRNVSLGQQFSPDVGRRGDIAAFGNANVTIDNAVCSDLILTTKHQGRIVLRNIEKQGEFIVNQEGGDILFED